MMALLALAPLGLAQEVSYFGPTLDFTTGGGTVPNRVAFADFNFDGLRDIAWINRGSGSVGVKLNLGGGTFAPAQYRSTGGTPSKMATGDLNNDLCQDLLVINQGTRTVSRYLGSISGNPLSAQSTTAVTLPLNSTPLDIQLADLDQDGDLDVVILLDGTTSTVLIRVNDGNGIFESSGFTLTSGSNASSLLVKDLDGDGDADIAVTRDSSPGQVRIFRNNGGVTINANMFPAFLQHTLTWTAAVNLRGISTIHHGGSSAVDLAVIEANSATSGHVALLRGAGSGTFDFLRRHPLPGNLHTLAVADVDSDGRGEIFVPSETENVVSVLKINSNGTLAWKRNLGTGAGPIQVLPADIDGDSDTDLLCAVRGANRVTTFDFRWDCLDVQPTWTPAMSPIVPIGLNFGATYAGSTYVTRFSLSGSSPSSVSGSLALPLVVDPLTTWVIASPTNPFFASTTGTLNASGHATTILNLSSLPALGLPPIELTIVAVATGPGNTVASNSATLSIL